MTEFLDVDGGRIAYEVTGEGPLVVLAHGMGDNRTTFRFLVPVLTEAGYQVASTDLRGHGESSTGWPSYTRTDTAGDLLALAGHQGRGRRYHRRHARRAGPAGHGQRRRALRPRPVPRSGSVSPAAVPEGARGCLEPA